MNKDSILASLTEDKTCGRESASKIDNTEHDLFGDIAINEAPSVADPPSLGTNAGADLPTRNYTIESAQNTIHKDTRIVDRKVSSVHALAPALSPVSAAIVSTPKNLNAHSILSKSGLLGELSSSHNSGGLFEEVDKYEHQKLEGNMSEQHNHMREIMVNQKQETGVIKKLEVKHLQNQQHYQTLKNLYTGHDSLHHQQVATMQSAEDPEQHLSNQMSEMAFSTTETSGFYREHSTPIEYNTRGNGNLSHTTQGSYYHGTREEQNQHLPEQRQHLSNFMQPSSTVGMHNSTQKVNLRGFKKVILVKPQEIPPLYIDIRVTEPMLIQTQSFLISSPPYWSYQITSQLARNQGTWLVRRRFRHVVALEDRLRQTCPGSIIPPRPEKHATRALEEASTQQSAEFAVQRSKELEQYLNLLSRHPVAGQSQVLRLFLGLQDDIGTAWPEVSTNALTRLQAVGAGVTMRVAESTNLTASSAPVHEWEEDAELLGLCSSENLRLGAVSQAVPKLEGTVMNLREQGDASGILGMELSKASKTLELDYKFYDILSSGLLRHGRRTKRLALEMSAAMESFFQQYKLVRYEKMAMQDRRHAIQRKEKERGRADARAVHLSQQQRHLQVNGQMHNLNQLEHGAISMDAQALDAVNEATEIGARLKLEINRVAIDRRTAWSRSTKMIASSMKEACNERSAIWQSTLEAFENLNKKGGQS